MKKMVSLLILVGIVTGVLFAGGSAEAEPAGEQKIQITYWQYFYETKKNTIDELIAEFERLNPNIEVIHETFPYENFDTKVAASVPAGEGPNVITLYYGWLPKYLDAGYLQPLPHQYFDPAEIEAEFFPLVQAVKYEGEYYALPTAVRSLALFWNKALFREAGMDPEAPPETLEELISMAQDLTIRDGNENMLQEGMTLMLQGQLHHWVREGLVRQFGGVPYSADNRTVTYNSPEGIDAFNWFIDLKKVYQVGDPQFLTDDVTAFKSGRAALHIDGSFRLGTLNALEGFDYGVTELPSYNGVHSNFASFWTHGITSFTSGAELEASAKFLQFITSSDAMELWLKNIGELTARREVALREEYQQDPMYGPFIRGLAYANSTYFVDETAQRQVFLDVYDKVILEGMSVEQAVNEAAAAEQAVLDKHYAN